jgi:hypothetical protein
VRRWVTRFGHQFARELRRRRSKPTARWHLDEMLVSIAGWNFWLWRAVDDEATSWTFSSSDGERTAFPEALIRRLPKLRMIGITWASVATLDVATCNRQACWSATLRAAAPALHMPQSNWRSAC